MTGRTQALSRFLLPVVVVALPVVLLLSSLRTMRELDQQKAVYLRNRVAMIAGRLENLPDPAAETAVFQALSEEEPNLVDLQVIGRTSTAGDQSALEAIWNGRELFRTQTLTDPEGRIYRAHVPFHSSAGPRCGFPGGPRAPQRHRRVAAMDSGACQGLACSHPDGRATWGEGRTATDPHPREVNAWRFRAISRVCG